MQVALTVPLALLDLSWIRRLVLGKPRTCVQISAAQVTTLAVTLDGLEYPALGQPIIPVSFARQVAGHLRQEQGFATCAQVENGCEIQTQRRRATSRAFLAGL